jgi:hypothetical protein
MTEVRDPAQVLASSGSPQAERSGENSVTIEVGRDLPASAPTPAVEGQSQVSPPLAVEDLQVLTRFLAGAVILGGGELLQRLRHFQHQIDTDPSSLLTLADAEEETAGHLLRYLALGMLARGEKRVARGLRQGAYFSLEVSRSILGGFDRLTDNALARPLRRPIDRRLKALGQEAAQIIDEGRLEEQKARYLATQTVGDVIDDLLDYLAENPEVAELIKRQIGAQSAGLADVVAENTRSVTVVGDYALEGLVRRLLRRRMRSDLPLSPYMGRPQTMYAPRPGSVEEMEHDERSGS